MLSDITRLVIETSDFLNVDEMLVEKDYYVTQVIHSLSDVENEFFRLIFAGGICFIYNVFWNFGVIRNSFKRIFFFLIKYR
jgi:hypothetical protein